jgi:hypothetical protein
MRTHIMAALGAAVLLTTLAGGASAQSRDNLDRWVSINNVSGFRTIVTLHAVPSHLRAAGIMSRDLIPGVTIRPGQSYRVNFDDGHGTCLYDLRATSNSSGRDWVVYDFNVCSQSHLNLGT